MNELLLLLLERCGNVKERLEGKCRGLKWFTRCRVNAKDFKSFDMVYVLLSRVRPEGDIEEFNAAAKVDRTPQGTNPDSPRDHRFWRRRKLSPARANNPQPGREPSPTQSYTSLNIILDDRLRAARVQVREQH
jgi:hypothetical protein